MTVSDQTMVRPPDAPPPGPEWKPIPGARHYEASHRGKLRSLDREVNGRRYRGVGLKTRLQNKTREGDTVYELADVRRDDGSKWTNTVHSFVLLAHVGPPGAGQETCHGPGGPLDNRWPENIGYGSKIANEGQKVRPPKPPPAPPAPCINHARCGGTVSRGGRRCHECVVEVGRAGAALLSDGADIEQAAELLGYGSAVGLFRLAVKYGGLRLVLDAGEVTLSDQPGDYAEQPQPWLRRVTDGVRAWLASGDAE